MPYRNLAERAGSWSARHWKTALFGWLIFVIAAIAAGSVAGTKSQADPGFTGETAKAQKVIRQAGFVTAVQESVLVQSKTMQASDPVFKSVIYDIAAAISKQPEAINLRTPLQLGGQSLISPDQHSAIIQFQAKGEALDASKKIQPVEDAVNAQQKAHPQFLIAEFGEASANNELNKTFEEDFKRAESGTFIITLVILLAAFGSAVAAGVPVILAFSGVLAATGLATLISHLYAAGDQTKYVILLVGMAVGVDYSLFYVRREREERAKGLSSDHALVKTASTSGMAILVSGITVFIAMASMVFSGNNIFISIALGSMIMVAVALIGSLSVLPSIIHKLGDAINKGRIPFFGKNLQSTKESKLWSWILGKVLRRPWLSAILSAAILIALALPILKMHTQLTGFTDLPKDVPIVKTYSAIQKAFPGEQVPAVVVIKAANVETATVQGQISSLKTKALASGQMFEPITSRTNPGGTVEVISIPIQGDGSNGASKAALDSLRKNIIPAVFGGSASQAYVTGQTAGTTDFNNSIKLHMPLVIAFVLILVFILLLISFRSIVIPVTAVILNLLSVGAAYGVLVLVFQHHWAEDILNFQSSGAITSWLPLFLFVILFGLSMDYHIFIVSRIKESADAGMETHKAVAAGIKRTAGVVTAAAIVMIAVFAVFITLSYLDFKQMGFGLAAAILIDVTLVRAVLLPSVMSLLGKWNWYLPKWLEWLPGKR